MESQQRACMLILIHPECAAELGAEAGMRYASLIQQHASQFQYIITHFFTSSNNWLSRSSFSPEIQKAYSTIRDNAQAVSQVARHDAKDMYGCTYGKEVPDYLIQNPQTDIYMAGGYENNCLWIAYKQLFQKLGWLLSENGTSVHYYKPLIFAVQQQGGLTPSHNYQPKQIADYERHSGDFHPNKVNYQLDIDKTKHMS